MDTDKNQPLKTLKTLKEINHRGHRKRKFNHGPACRSDSAGRDSGDSGENRTKDYTKNNKR
jgi:hypothetical protein